MKNKIIILFSLLFLTGLFFVGCVHELPHDYCSSNPIVLTVTSTDANVNQNDGIIVATATGGSAIQYSLNGANFVDSGTFAGLPGDTTYQIVARNSWGCTDTALVQLGHITPTDPCNGITITVSVTKTDPLPNQSNGTITATAGPGSGFTYSLNNGPFQSTGNFTGLASGNYTVTAKSADGCMGTAQTTLGTNDPCAGVIITVSTTQVNPTNGQSNGSITATATGGTGFTYSLNNGAFQANGTFTGLAAGNYSIIAKNANGCTGVKNITLTGVDPCAGVTVTVSTTQVNPTIGQSNGSITATATGGTGFTYSINNGTFQASGNFTGLAAGNYSIIAKNSNGCVGVKNVTLTAIDPCAGVTVTVSTTQVNPTTGQSNGSITATATGGTGFTYSINNGAFQASGNFTGLASGNYSITAKNSNGCIGVKNVTLGSNNPCTGVNIVVTTTKVDPTLGQSNGSITATATGATGFTYSLNNGTFQASGTFTGLAAGTYTITAKSSLGCLGSTTVTLVGINPCTGVNIVVSTTKVDPTVGQSNGSITATATGATGFTYSLNNGAFQASGTFSGLAAGTYTITAKSSQGCLGTATVTLTAINPCTGVNIVVTTTKVNPTLGQSNGSITATATGATGFTYSLNNGTFQASGTFSGLAAATYTVTAKSALGCLGSTTVTLTAVNPCTNISIVINTSVTNMVPCSSPANNGQITVTATGSTGFTYNINAGAYQSSNVFSNLATGNYTIGVKDLNNCTNTATATVGTAPRGPLFAQVQSLIITRCSASSCHTNGGSAAGYNFDNDCNIISSWSAIRNSCVNSTSMPKPPQAPLTAAEKQKITNWINAGHTYGN
jgi:large repetitive protein